VHRPDARLRRTGEILLAGLIPSRSPLAGRPGLEIMREPGSRAAAEPNLQVNGVRDGRVRSNSGFVPYLY
jgi:hypothetical protein